MPEKQQLSDLQKAYQRIPDAVREDLLRFCGVWAPNLATDPLNMARNEGKRLAGLYLLHMSGEIKLPKETV